MILWLCVLPLAWSRMRMTRQSKGKKADQRVRPNAIG